MAFTQYTIPANTFLSEKSRAYVLGAERLVEQLRAVTQNTPGLIDSLTTNFPPYNIVKLSEFEYLVELALAGYDAGSIDVETAEGVLTIKSEASASNADATEEFPQYLHRGLARRAFKRQFFLVETMEVVDVEMENGIVRVKIVNRLPEHKHPKKFEIAVKKTASKK